MPTLNATDLTKRLTGQADKSGVFVMQPSGFDPYEPGGVKSDSPEVSGALVNGSSPGFHNAVCFENHRTGSQEPAPADVFGKVAHAVNKNGDGERYAKIDVAETRNTFSNSEARTQEVVVHPQGEVVAIDMDKNKPTNADKPVRKGGAGFGVSEKGASYTLTARDQHAVAYAIDSMGSNAMKSKNPKSGCREVECAPTLTTVDSAPVKHQGGTAVVAFLPGNSGKARSVAADEEVSPTLMRTQGESGNKIAVATECIGFNAESGSHDQTPHENLGETLAACHKCGVAIGLDRASFNQGRNAKFGFSVEEECAPTVVSKGPGAVSFEPGIAKREGAPHRFSDEVTSTLRSDMGDNLPAVAVDYIVRRLTPLECERLQGLPDGYTKIPHRGKPAEECPDTPRYKALGNGWAVNCARWICRRIQNYDNEHEQENTDGNE